MVGYHVKECPQIERQVARERHTIGNHGYSQGNLTMRLLKEIGGKQRIRRESTNFR
jgi:hypothetical protein